MCCWRMNQKALTDADRPRALEMLTVSGAEEEVVQATSTTASSRSLDRYYVAGEGGHGGEMCPAT